MKKQAPVSVVSLSRNMHYAWVVIHLYCTFCCIIFVHSNFKSFELFSEIPSKINPSKKSDPSAVGVIKRRKNLYTKFNF